MIAATLAPTDRTAHYARLIEELRRSQRLMMDDPNPPRRHAATIRYTEAVYAIRQLDAETRSR